MTPARPAVPLSDRACRKPARRAFKLRGQLHQRQSQRYGWCQYPDRRRHAV